jgi:hypothetical protein
MAERVPPGTMKSSVRAAVPGRPGLASQELFSEETAQQSILASRHQWSRTLVALKKVLDFYPIFD